MLLAKSRPKGVCALSVHRYRFNRTGSSCPNKWQQLFIVENDYHRRDYQFRSAIAPASWTATPVP
ncbi:hypothetical protein MES4922_30481 [Mesorhizobium ventifaucium]|uniref:Uncharacterized protein n=1 Tax=Mesorhizobium ventifaucium TaxID=666020 RepID=A0ABN8JYM0_9HYPH|nr:hypothetical protein MES4922_30481 [Mesorhizobium ventifaucium]